MIWEYNVDLLVEVSLQERFQEWMQKAAEHSEFISENKRLEKGKIHLWELGTGRPSGSCTEEMLGSLFYIRDEYSLSGIRLHRAKVWPFLEFTLTPLSGWAGGVLALFGSHWTCLDSGRCDFYYVNHSSVIFTMLMSV